MTAQLLPFEQAAPTVEPQPSYAYEAEQRRRIASRDWARVHIDADRREPLGWFETRRRGWR